MWQQRGGAGERSNERARGIESCTARRCYVAEERTCDDGAGDAQAEVHDTVAGTLGEPVRDVAGDESKKDAANYWHWNA